MFKTQYRIVQNWNGSYQAHVRKWRFGKWHNLYIDHNNTFSLLCDVKWVIRKFIQPFENEWFLNDEEVFEIKSMK